MEQLFKDLWKNKPILIVVVVIIGFLIYLLWKSNQSAIVAPGGQTSSTHPRARRREHGTFPIPTGGGGMGN